jgi:hypothetical protein
MDLRKIFRTYLDLGYQPILLFPKTKQPILKDWNKKYDSAPYFEILKQRKNFNLGLLLGELLDIEGDNKTANYFLNNLFKDIIHPTFSSYKSTHHLFRSRNNSYFTRFVNSGIEIRSHQHQSVAPPSKHAEMDYVYTWTSPPTHIFEIPVLTEELEFKIKRFCGLGSTITKPNQQEVWCGICTKKCFCNKIRLEKEINYFKSMNLKWTCHKCRPKSTKEIIKAAISSGC